MPRTHLGRADARRIAVAAQLLTADRPVGLVDLVDDLTLIQIDPTAAVAPNVDLVAWSRLGGAYEPSDLTRALEEERTLVELQGYVRPATALPLHLPDLSGYAGHPTVTQWVDANADFHEDLLDALRADGPLLSKEIADTAAVPWGSSGWTNNRNVTQMLEFLAARGEVGIVGRRGKQRLWDLGERAYPTFEPLPADEADLRRRQRRLRSLGLARAKHKSVPGEPTTVGEVGVTVTVEGIDGEWQVDPDALDLPFSGRTALLSPLDRLVFDRERTLQLFDFDYILEMYKPAAKRRWGYFALPVLHDDRLVGKLDAKADRKAGTFTINALHEDVVLSSSDWSDIETEIESLAEWLGLMIIDRR